MWKESLPQFLTKYLLQQILAASSASLDSCSNSSETCNCTDECSNAIERQIAPNLQNAFYCGARYRYGTHQVDGQWEL